MTALSDVRDRLRQDLSDTEALRWPDSQLDRHIEQALGELSLAIPLEATVDLATTVGSRELPLDGIPGLIAVEAVEYPVGEFPPEYAGFSTFASVLTLHCPEPPAGADARLFCTLRHTLDEAGTTLAPHLLDVLLTGAGAYAVLELAAASAGELTTDPRAAERHASWARARLTAFGQLLYTNGRKNAVRPRRLYARA